MKEFLIQLALAGLVAVCGIVVFAEFVGKPADCRAQRQ